MNTTEDQANILPTKVSRVPTSFTGDDSNGWKCDPESFPRWTAQPVLTWVESLAAATEAGERQQSNDQGPMMVDSLSLSAPSVVTSPVAWALDNPAFKHSHTPTAMDRRRSLPVSKPKDWDLYFLGADNDPQASGYVCQITSLVVHIESLTHQDVDVPAKALIEDYPLVQFRFEHIFNRIIENPDYKSEAEKRRALTTLYEETIAKLQDIAETATFGEKPRGNNSASKMTPPPVASSVSFETSPVAKKDLSKYMTAWLRDNWTNPYPDEEGLAEMASACGTTPTIVSNWLINARTRKWRPAIIKAVELNRPADYLLEDSLCIFDGGTVAPLPAPDNLDLGEMDDDDHDLKRIKHSHSSI